MESDAFRAVDSFELQRASMEAGPLAPEMAAESYGTLPEAIWDDFNQSEDRWEVFRRIRFAGLRLGTWSEPHRVEHDIVIRSLQTGALDWSLEQWRSWLDGLQRSGMILDQMQWRHVAFDPDAEGGPVSDYEFEFHAQRPEPAMRLILRGRMKLFWEPAAHPSTFPSLRRVEVLEAEWLERAGLPPFEHVIAADVSPSDQDLVLEPNLQVVDLNQDHLPEIILSRINRVFWNQGNGRFQTGHLLEFPVEHFHQGLLADFNGDAQLDFLAVSTEGLAFYPGDGKGAFARAPRLQTDLGDRLVNPFTLTAGDLDGDGDLDVWLGQYKVPYQQGQMPTPYYDANDGYPAFLLKNRGDGHFDDVTRDAGLEALRFRRTYSGSLVDVDGDRDLDLLVVSDFAGADLYLNDGRGRFENVTATWLGNPHGFGMAHAFGDWNLDGHMDFLMIGMHSAAADRMQTLGMRLTDSHDELAMRQAMAYGNRLYWGDAQQFHPADAGSAVQRTGWSWGVANIDFDLDGDQDLYIVNGHISGARTYDYESEFWREDLHIGNSEDQPALNAYFESKQLRYRQAGASYGGYERNRFLLNLQGREWLETAYLFDLAMPQDCRNVVAADLDGNGRQDLVVTTFELWPNERQVLHLYPNFDRSTHAWAGVSLQESPSWPPLMGASLVFGTSGGTHVRPLVSGDGYRSQSPYQAVLGLGEGTRLESITLRWPNGQERMLPLQGPNQYLKVAPEP